MFKKNKENSLKKNIKTFYNSRVENHVYLN